MSQQITFGLHAVLSLLENQPERVERLCVLADKGNKKIAEIVQAAKKLSIPVESLSRRELDNLVRNGNHQGVVAFANPLQMLTEKDLNKILENISGPAFILILDGLQDPHNLGACFRSADAAGVQVIIAPKDKSVGLTPIVSKVASGAAETVPFVQVTNLARTIEMLKEAGIWIYGADEDAEKTLFQTDFKGPVALVLGAEGTGLRRLTKDSCDGLAKIPMQGSVASLNVSVATGIFLFEVVRQRSFKK